MYHHKPNEFEKILGTLKSLPGKARFRLDPRHLEFDSTSKSFLVYSVWDEIYYFSLIAAEKID